MKKIELWGREFSYYDTGYMTGEENMAWDIAKAKALQEGGDEETFRVYAWKPWCVSLGNNQKSDGISKAKCDANGIDIVTRPTGGRAVLHANELTYSIIMKLSPELDRNKVYKDIHLFFIKIFAELGADLDFVRSTPNFNKFYKESELAFACFASSAKYEVTLGDKKIVGSAQRVFGDVLLQHGSILLGAGHELLPDLLPIEDSDKIQRAKDYLANETATLSQACSREITYSECAESIASGLVSIGIKID